MIVGREQEAIVRPWAVTSSKSCRDICCGSVYNAREAGRAVAGPILSGLGGGKVRTPQGSVPRNAGGSKEHGECNRKDTAPFGLLIVDADWTIESPSLLTLFLG